MDAASRLPQSRRKVTRGFVGELLGPEDIAYEEARRVHNGLIDRRPAAIARCRGTADVVDALAFARSNGLEVAVRGGGHNVAGHATVDGGIVIDLSHMKGIHVDPDLRRVRAEAGLTWGELNRETQIHGLATTGGIVSTTGIAGLTLGGGLGWLMAKHGLTVDNVESAEIVTADGRILTVDREQHPDLFWALRGGGGNFGVVTAFEYRLHPVGPTIVGGFVAHSFERAAEVFRFHRDVVVPALSDDLTVHVGLIHGPDGSKLAVLALCHCGDLRDGELAAAPIKAFPTPVLDVVAPMTYCELNGLLDTGYPRGALNYWKSSFLASLSDEAIATAVDCFARVSSPMSQLFFEHVHGKAASIAPDATAFAHRRQGYNMLVLSQWADGGDTTRNIAWARETHTAMAPFCSTARYLNYQSDAGREAAPGIFAGNYPRLQQVKRTYDPQNVFHLNQNVAPD
jgi:FAD/FMN-containing dehydrogenase